MMICRGCGKVNDANTPIGKEDIKPKQGDISICFYCGTISTFTQDGDLEAATPEIMMELKRENPEGYFSLFKAQVMIQQRIRSN